MPTLYPLVMGREVMLATEHYLSAAAGARIFARGGNAVDAAIGATLVEGVVNPHMHTIGGEAPMLVYSPAERRVVAINGNMTAPGLATIDHYRSLGLDLIPGDGLLAAGVPAAFGALVCALTRFGTRTLTEVLEPALALCEDGFPMHAGLAGDAATPTGAAGMRGGASVMANAQKFCDQWPSSARLYMSDGKPLRVGAIVKNPALAKCFRRLMAAEASARNRGRDAGLDAARARFYRGDIAREIVAWSEANGGLLSAADLADFTTRIEGPVHAGYRGVEVFKCPPWSQGPVFLQQLRILDGTGLGAMGHNSADYIHFLTETAKLAFADREAYYGDPAFTEVPIEALLSAQYALLRRDLIDARKASMDLRPGDPWNMKALADFSGVMRGWGHGTIQVAAADRSRTFVSITASGGWIPSSPVIDELGFPLGTRVQTFYLNERHPNALQPGKRPRTTLSPSLAMRAGEPYLAFGTPGGDQQDQWTLQFFLNVVEFGMNIQEAIEAPKFSTFHFPSTFFPHNSRPGVLKVEDRVAQSVRDDLSTRGHKVEVRPAWCEGNVLAVELDPERGILRGGADPRGQICVVMPAQVIGW